ncbi:MAG: hypothetical protein WC467_01195 [Patescibacteria group bacterium]
MKKQLFIVTIVVLTIILMPLGTAYCSEFPSTLLQSVTVGQRKSVIQNADSLNIILMPNGKYYLICPLCPITTSKGFLVKEILDSLSFIDSSIPEHDWVKAYLSENYIYESMQKWSQIKLEEGRLTINNRFDENWAVLVGDSLKKFTVCNVQKNSANDARNSGTFLMLCLVAFGLIIGYAIYSCKPIIAFIVGIFTAALVFLFLKYMFLQTIETLTMTMGLYLMGNVFMIIILAIVLRKKKNNPK